MYVTIEFFSDLALKQVAYLGATFSLTYDATTMSLVQTSGPALSLNGTQTLTPGQTVALARGSFFLQSAST
jgi:hypothetical protein